MIAISTSPYLYSTLLCEIRKFTITAKLLLIQESDIFLDWVQWERTNGHSVYYLASLRWRSFHPWTRWSSPCRPGSGVAAADNVDSARSCCQPSVLVLVVSWHVWCKSLWHSCLASSRPLYIVCLSSWLKIKSWMSFIVSGLRAGHGWWLP